jgi:hypothetical protein
MLIYRNILSPKSLVYRQWFWQQSNAERKDLKSGGAQQVEKILRDNDK